MGKKKEKKQLEPQYYASATNISTLNYNVYYMSLVEKIFYAAAAFIVGAAIGYLFYGGIGKDEFGQPTTVTHVLNLLIPGIVGCVTVKIFMPMRVRQIIKKRKKMLNSQFRDMLDALATSFGAGKNVPDSFYAAYSDMKIQYENTSFIVKELEVIISGMQNNFPIEDMLMDFGKRSGNDDIRSFADVFQTSYRKGGNIKDVIRTTHEILSDKMEIAEEIETIVTSNKNEQNIMTVMPIGLIAVIKMMSPEFAANFVTPTGVMATTVAVVLFFLGYYIGKQILEIKV